MKNQRKRRKLFKRLISGVSALALSVGLLGSIPASADDSNVGYKYTLFAYSSEEGAISSSAANFCVNGNIATNGTISAGQNLNVNGEKKEHANEAMPDLSKAINEKYFAENVDVKAENYKNEDVNINVLAPLDVKGKAEFKGNIKLTAGVKAMGDIVLSGGVLNNDNTVLFSENGSININSENVSLTGLIYAPKGNIVIESKSLNLNSVVMIANKITLNAPNVNINSNAEMAKFVQEAIDKNNNNGSGGEEKPVTDPAIYAYGEYNEETKSVDIEWYSNVTGEFAVLESLNGTDYTIVSKVSDDTKYSIKVASDFIKKFYKVTIIKDGKTIESIPFSIVNANGKYSTELLDTDKDGLADLYEEMLGTDKTLPDTDKDGLTDYEEAYITNTDPTKYDSVTEGVSDADADNDKDGLTNKREIELKTDPNSDDTDGDTLKDGDELSKYNTDPIKRDTDGDELEDDDEFKFNCDPNKKDTDNNGIIDGKEKHQQTLDVVPDNKEQAVTKVSVSMNVSGNIEKTTTVDSIMNKDVLCSNVVGLVGEPFSIESKSSFDKATITFTVDKTKLGEIGFDNLMFLWYDRENDNFVELETSHDAENSTVSIETTHFSEYMIVDSDKWFRNWEQIEEDRKRIIGSGSSTVHTVKPVATAVLIHCSDASDPNFYNPDANNNTVVHYTNYRTLICEHLISSMSVLDYMTYVYYQKEGAMSYGLSNDKDALKACADEYIIQSNYYGQNPVYAGYGVATAAFNMHYDIQEEHTSRIIFITDSDLIIEDLYLNLVKQYGGSVYFVRVGGFTKTDVEKTNIKKIADATDGKVYDVATLDELYTELDPKQVYPDAIDTDGDGFTDDEETYGLVVDSSGTRYWTKPGESDSDGDGLDDNVEVDVNRIYRLAADENGNEVWKCFHNMHSIPTKQDSDGDGINDKDDKYPLSRKLEFIDKLKDMEKYIDEFKASKYKDYIEYRGIEKENTSKIAINIIRGCSKSYRGIKWLLTSGDVFDYIKNYINEKDPSIMKAFTKYSSSDNNTFNDPNQNEIDLLHMMATLSAFYPSNSIISDCKELAGWAADLQSMIYDIKIKAYATDENLNEVALEKTGKILTDDERKLPHEQKKYVDTHFSMSDMLADIDAQNIYHLYSQKENMYLSEMLEDYYNKHEYYKKRYSIFVNGYGGIDNLERRTNEFTKGDELIKHHFLNSYAKEAARDKDVSRKYESSRITTSYVEIQAGLIKYSLPNPSRVTEEESEALTYAFITFLKRQLEYEYKP